jgi:hypothetical protein
MIMGPPLDDKFEPVVIVIPFVIVVVVVIAAEHGILSELAVPLAELLQHGPRLPQKLYNALLFGFLQIQAGAKS